MSRNAEDLYDAIQEAAKSLPNGVKISIEIEKEGYGVYLMAHGYKKDLDGGDGMLSDILEGIELARAEP